MLPTVEKVNPLRKGVVWLSRAVTYLVYLYLLFVEVILLLGFLLLLGGANPSSSFVEWVYRSLDRVMKPFRGIFEPIELGQTGSDVPSIFETSVLFAMIVYAILAIVVNAVVMWLDDRMNRLQRQDAAYERQEAVNEHYESIRAMTEAQAATAQAAAAQAAGSPTASTPTTAAAATPPPTTPPPPGASTGSAPPPGQP